MRHVRYLAVLAIFAAAAMYVPNASAEEAQEQEEFETFVQVSLQNSVSEDGYTPTAQLLIQRPVYAEYFGITCFALASPAYGEAHCGLFVEPIDWLYLSLSAGIETHESVYRVSGTVMVNAGVFQAVGVFEYGGSGRWHTLRAGFRIGEHIRLGLMSQRFEGEGPFVQLGVGRVSLRAAYLFDIERYVDERAEFGWRNNRFYTALIALSVRASP
ncbi:MAG: hypothetical protein U9Q03_05860 [Patescibacteria group bacterium]|nr:hypothetical protein [Patescibacteria group bacterium]